jgi:hypothetical protein
MVRAGWAAPFIIYPSIPGELDMPLFLRTAEEAVEAKLGIWGDTATLLAYEYRAAEKLFDIANNIIVDNEKPKDPRGWRERYCVDMRSRVLFGPEDYFEVDRSTGCGSGLPTFATPSASSTSRHRRGLPV